MITWSIQKFDDTPRVRIARIDANGKLTVLPGICPNEHMALVEIAEYFQIGDLIKTPSGKTFFSSPSGEPNN